MAFSFKIDNHDPDLHVTLTGILNEDAKLPELPKEIPGRLVLDLEHLKMLNSIGCRNWLIWMRDISAGKIVLSRCSPALIGQVNVLRGFIPADALVESFFLPYHCASCDSITNVLFTTGQQDVIADQLPCPKCKAQMECEVLSQAYQRFLPKKTS